MKIPVPIIIGIIFMQQQLISERQVTFMKHGDLDQRPVNADVIARLTESSERIVSVPRAPGP